jgi:hypothetical protein
MKLDLVEALAHANGFAAVAGGCPRAAVATYLYDREGIRRTRAANVRFDGKCDCNDGADTLTTASSTCCAQHSEVRALMTAAKEGWYPFLHMALVTRPPCIKCLPYLLESPLEVLAVGREWPDRDGTQTIWEKFGRDWCWID